MKKALAALLLLSPLPVMAQQYPTDVYGSYGSVPGNEGAQLQQQQQMEQQNMAEQRQMEDNQRMQSAAYALTPGDHGNADDARLSPSNYSIDNPALNTDNPNAYR